jgi:hypothetical protein
MTSKWQQFVGGFGYPEQQLSAALTANWQLNSLVVQILSVTDTTG